MSGVKKDHIELSEWNQWANHVLAELKRLDSAVDDLKRDLTLVTMEVAELRVKSSIWGAASGAITVLMIFAIGWVKSGIDERKQPDQRPIYYTVPYQQTSPAPNQPQSHPNAPQVDQSNKP